MSAASSNKTQPLKLPAQLYESLFNMPRTIVFRGATFAALKAYCRDHYRSTGVVLNNTAALDLILREHLKSYIFVDAE